MSDRPIFTRALALSLAIATITAIPAQGSPKRAIRVAAVALIVDGENPTDTRLGADTLRIYEDAVARLRKNGFAILPTADPQKLFGGDALEKSEIAWLHLDLRKPDFTFNVVLLPPRWSKTKVGELRFVTAASVVIEDIDIKVPLSIRERDRRLHGEQRAQKLLDELVPSNLVKAVRDPLERTLLTLNDIATSESAFLDVLRRLPEGKGASDPAALVAIATDSRLERDPELRIELLRRAVVAGGERAEAALGRALAQRVLTRTPSAQEPDPELTDLLIEALGLMGAAPGDALADRIDQLALIELVDLRRRFSFRREQSRVDRRIERLTLAAVAEAPSFAAAEELIARVPMGSLSAVARLRLRDDLYARLNLGDLELLYPRLIHLFPESEYPPHEDDHLDRAYLEGASELAHADADARLAYYRDYLRCAPRGGAADALAARLDVEGLLENELARALHGASSAAAEERALLDVFGPTAGPRARAALARAIVRNLGDDPSDAQVRDLHSRHPELAEVRALARKRGLERDREVHTFQVAVGDDEAAALRALGSGAMLRGELTRRDLSPIALVALDQKVPKSNDRGLAVIELPERARVLLRQGRVVRVLLDDSDGRFHHGVRTGDSRAALITALGDPDEARALMFGREVLRWRGLDGNTVAFTAVIDGDKASFFYEEDEAEVREAAAALW